MRRRLRQRAQVDDPALEDDDAAVAAAPAPHAQDDSDHDGEDGPTGVDDNDENLTKEERKKLKKEVR